MAGKDGFGPAGFVLPVIREVADGAYIGQVSAITFCRRGHQIIKGSICPCCLRRKRVKHFLKSKTFWVNLLAGIVLIAESVAGEEVVIPLEAQAAILAVVNLMLRKVTREPVGW